MLREREKEILTSGAVRGSVDGAEIELRLSGEEDDIGIGEAVFEIRERPSESVFAAIAFVDRHHHLLLPAFLLFRHCFSSFFFRLSFELTTVLIILERYIEKEEESTL